MVFAVDHTRVGHSGIGSREARIILWTLLEQLQMGNVTTIGFLKWYELFPSLERLAEVFDVKVWAEHIMYHVHVDEAQSLSKAIEGKEQIEPRDLVVQAMFEHTCCEPQSSMDLGCLTSRPA
jgi:hypothetical protein